MNFVLSKMTCLVIGVLNHVLWPICIIEKDRELGIAQTEIKALKATDVSKEKTLEEVQENV